MVGGRAKASCLKMLSGRRERELLLGAPRSPPFPAQAKHKRRVALSFSLRGAGQRGASAFS